MTAPESDATLSPEAFVEECYRRFLQRPADPKGVAFYADRLRDGASRLDVIQTFVTGREFFALVCRGAFGDGPVTPFLAFAPPGHYYSPLPSTEDVTRYAPAWFGRGPEAWSASTSTSTGSWRCSRRSARSTRDLTSTPTPAAPRATAGTTTASGPATRSRSRR